MGLYQELRTSKHVIGSTATMLKCGLLLAFIIMMAALIEAEAVAEASAEAAALPDPDAEPQRGIIGFGLGYALGRLKGPGGYRGPYYGRRRPYYGRRGPYWNRRRP